MLFLNTLTDNPLPLRSQDTKSRAKQADERATHVDFQSYLASALQQQSQSEHRREEIKAPKEQVIPEHPALQTTEVQRSDNTADYRSLVITQKVGHEAPRGSETVTENKETLQREPTKTPGRSVTVTRSDRELLEALGLINRKTEAMVKKPFDGILRAGMDEVAQRQSQKPEKKAVIFKSDSPTHTLTVLEKSPDLVLMSSDGLRKLGEKLGISLLGKVYEKLNEKNRPIGLNQQDGRAEIRSESTPVVVQQRSQKPSANDTEFFSGQHEPRGGRQVVGKYVSRETAANMAANSVRLPQAENLSLIRTSQQENITPRADLSLLPGSDVRIIEGPHATRGGENLRSAVENPLLRPELVRQFNEIIQRAQVLVTDTQNAQFSVKLFPREIGRMEIDLKMIEGEIRGKIVVESENVKNELENFLQNQEHTGSEREFDLNKIDIEVRSGNSNAQNPQQTHDTQEVLQNLITQAASEAYNTIENTVALGNALYA